MQQPVLVAADRTTILGGHLRWEGAKRAGHQVVPLFVCHACDEAEMLQVLLDSNLQRVKSNEQLAREGRILRDSERAKAKDRQANAKKGHRGGSLPSNSTEAKGEARQHAAAALGIGATKLEAAINVVNQIDQLAAAGKTEEAKCLKDALNKSVTAASKMAKPKAPQTAEKEEAAIASAQAQAIIKQISKDLIHGLMMWPIERLTKFKAAATSFRKEWEETLDKSPEAEAGK